MLHYEFKPDISDRTNLPTGNALLVVKREHIVVDVAMCKNTLEQVHSTMRMLNKVHGHIYVHENTGALFDYEYVQADIDCRIDEINREMEA